ncbi:hypothetical protein A3D42_03045 [Candidatus Nomurabacteria bacterium RIFCSPHIGHO2_02_FULL_41_18]|uniref:Uncharacterized protein n=1 Tax=Candidatus Nomurabacteria bacterium RIFCSPHIGHO2_02_FULL_41_18 TaxID=1801754 RepID=A0A1F6W6K7_9BACT|nr:MAG: hypothetical protein A2737_02310 [Candidatus Nomurabacteria bacterium RIFCSPHIGHO2_01_FULL_41_71]OGI77529.1 MAG: hypothetical protein A3D42_03045 [Candidatus Nomurabacteria bacterium RIFCSPHIGHO2_02_FULL_41_18]OGI89546.1 MAG: hypothetical protein A3B01_00125 [Candidatus Nomurabacteria bacterium RIFCSPLOWO2_01_FULL_41_52b]
MENKKRFLSFKQMTRKDYGRNAITGLLGGYVLSIAGYPLFEVIGSIVALLGLICGLVWLYRTITKKP